MTHDNGVHALHDIPKLGTITRASVCSRYPVYRESVVFLKEALLCVCPLFGPRFCVCSRLRHAVLFTAEETIRGMGKPGQEELLLSRWLVTSMSCADPRSDCGNLGNI